MSKLSDKFAAGKKALQERVAAEDSSHPFTPASTDATPLTSSPLSSLSLLRVPGPQHGSVTTMKIEVLKAELDVFKASKPTLKLRPEDVQASVWANRHQDSFLTSEFTSLKAEIESAGENIQPIKVRALKEPNPLTGARYEIVFGHRRHRACLDLGIGLNAIVDDVNEKELFIQMDRENRERADLRPYEQGAMYLRALESGLFSSLRLLCKDVGADPSNVSKSISIAKLPEAILDCFESRLDIQTHWGTAIKAALEKEPDLLSLRVESIKKLKLDSSLSSQQAFGLLVGKVRPAKLTSRTVTIGKITLSIAETNKKVIFEFSTPSKSKLAKIESLVANILAE